MTVIFEESDKLLFEGFVKNMLYTYSLEMLHQNGPELLQRSEASVKEPLVQDNVLKEKWGNKKISHSIAALNWKRKKKPDEELQIDMP